MNTDKLVITGTQLICKYVGYYLVGTQQQTSQEYLLPHAQMGNANHGTYPVESESQNEKWI